MNRILKGILGALTLGFLACGGAVAPASSENESDLEVSTFWTTGSQQKAFGEFASRYSRDNPQVRLTNAVEAAGGRYAYNMILDQRIRSGNPPDAFRVPAADAFKKYIGEGLLANLDDLWAAIDGDHKFGALKEQVSVDGHVYGIPVNVHRANTMFYDKTLIANRGISEAEFREKVKTMDGLFEVAAKIHDPANGVTAFAVGGFSVFGPASFYSCFLPSALGKEDWRSALTEGQARADVWQNERVRSALEHFKKYVSLSNADYKTIGDWNVSIKLLANHRAGLAVIGDQAVGELENTGSVAGTSFGWFACPGTQDTYYGHPDIFAIATKALHPKNARRWMEIVASAEAQSAFNTYMGSIPARTDVVSETIPNAYVRAAIDESRILPFEASFTRVPPAFGDHSEKPILDFIADPNSTAEDTMQALVNLCKSDGMGCR